MSCFVLRSMPIVKTLKPGQKGTKELMTRFGPSLLCVRYRYDEDRREHVKTVELVVQRRSREGEAGCSGASVLGVGARRGRTCGVGAPGVKRARVGSVAGRRVAVRIGWREKELQQRVKSAGGRRDPVRRVWMLRRDAVERLDLQRRVVGGGG